MRGPRLRQDRAIGHNGPSQGRLRGRPPPWLGLLDIGGTKPSWGNPRKPPTSTLWVLGWHAAKHCPKAPAAAGTRVTVAPGILGGLIYSVEQDFQTECTTEPSMRIRGQRSRNPEVLPGPAQLSSNHHPETQGNQKHVLSHDTFISNRTSI